MKFFTYTYNKSTSTGGIEVVTRFLQNVAYDQGFDVFEIFHGLSCEEIYPENGYVNYIKMPSNDNDNNLKKKLITYVKRRWVAYQYLKEHFSNTPGVLVIHHPSMLNFIPKSVLKINKVILMQHNTFDIYFNLTGKIGFHLNFKYIDNIIVYTEVDKIKLSELYPKINILDKTISIPLACRFNRLLKVRENNYSKRLVTIARIEEFQKNFQAMCNVMSLLPQDYTLDIYGAGTVEEIKKLDLLIAQYPQVTFKGIAKDVEGTFNNYSLFLMTSYFEGFGLTLIEARSQGLPLVVFNTFDALSSILSDGENGFAISPFNVDHFAKSIMDILASKESYLKFSKNALLKAEETDSIHVKKLWKKVINTK